MFLRVALLVLLVLVSPWPGHAAEAPVRARHHMAATANPLATQAALAVLRDGGTAADAAIAGQMMLAVVEPQSSGLGGGSLILSWDARARRLTYLEGLTGAPGGVVADYAHEQGLRIDPATLDRSGRVVGVPGTLRTLALLHARAGRLPWPRLLRDAIATAEGGFALPPYLHRVLLERPALARKPPLSAYFDAAGTPLPVGTTVRNPALATMLRAVAAQGAAALYAGPVADDIAAAVHAGSLPGTLTTADLAAWQPHERAPVCLVAFGRRICSAAPPASGGIALLQQLALLDRVRIGDTPAGGVDEAHLFLEAARLSEADRRAYVGDPDQVGVPAAGLLDPAYLDARARTIRPRAAGAVLPGSPPEKHAARPPSDPVGLPATTHLAMVDDAGNAIAFTTTINLNFGSDIVVDGMVLNDAIVNFAGVPVVGGIAAANAAAPGKRPASTMAPTIVFGPDGAPELIVGAGGAARIIDSVAETIVGVLARGLDVRAAIEQPRVGGQNRAQELERGTAAAGLAGPLRALGHEVRVVDMNAAVQAIAITPRGLEGWGDAHRDGVAAGD